MTRLKNLQIIDMNILKLLIAKSNKVNIKFIIIMWNDTNKIKISWKELYN